MSQVVALVAITTLVIALAVGGVIVARQSAAPASAPTAVHPGAPGLTQFRQGEIGAASGPTVDALRLQRHGEINAASGSTVDALRLQRRGEIGADAQ
jgi:hypothetical protein